MACGLPHLKWNPYHSVNAMWTDIILFREENPVHFPYGCSFFPLNISNLWLIQSIHVESKEDQPWSAFPQVGPRCYNQKMIPLDSLHYSFWYNKIHDSQNLPWQALRAAKHVSLSPPPLWVKVLFCCIHNVFNCDIRFSQAPLAAGNGRVTCV